MYLGQILSSTAPPPFPLPLSVRPPAGSVWENGQRSPHKNPIGKRRKFEKVRASKSCFADTAIKRPIGVDVTAIRSAADSTAPHLIAPRAMKKAAKATGTKTLNTPNTTALAADRRQDLLRRRRSSGPSRDPAIVDLSENRMRSERMMAAAGFAGSAAASGPFAIFRQGHLQGRLKPTGSICRRHRHRDTCEG
jgi:hypothetical protein